MLDSGRSLAREVLRRAHDYTSANWDTHRFGPDPVADKPGKIVFNPDVAAGAFLDLANHLVDYEWASQALADEGSRRLLADLLAFRVLGCGHVKLPTNTDAYWETYRTIESRFLRRAKVARSGPFDLNLYSLRLNGTDLELIGNPLSLSAMLLGQYYFERDGVRVEPEAGDVVIDGGGCWGETAIGFAGAVGPAGRVFSFEFVPSNLEVFRTNLSTCGDLAARITLVERALADRGGLELGYTDCGPASAVTTRAPDRVPTVTIDDFVADRGLERVDFIKMDIEGSEVAALQGARETLRRFRPKLAVCLYHRPHDPFVIPRLIRAQEPSYEFYLGHYTIHLEETVLYARAGRPAAAGPHGAAARGGAVSPPA